MGSPSFFAKQVGARLCILCTVTGAGKRLQLAWEVDTWWFGHPRHQKFNVNLGSAVQLLGPNLTSTSLKLYISVRQGT